MPHPTVVRSSLSGPTRNSLYYHSKCGHMINSCQYYGGGSDVCYFWAGMFKNDFAFSTLSSSPPFFFQLEVEGAETQWMATSKMVSQIPEPQMVGQKHNHVRMYGTAM